MSEELLINVNEFETRAALRCGGALQELHIARTPDYTLTGNIYRGSVRRVLSGMQAAFVDIGLARPGFLHTRDMYPRTAAGSGPGDDAAPDIRDLLAAGQKVLVQVLKDPIASKGARLTTRLTIASRYTVLTPFYDQIGVSQRIEGEANRARLVAIMEEVRERRGISMGVIARTAADSANARAIAADIDALLAIWEQVLASQAQASAPELVYREPPLHVRLIRDLSGAGLARIVVDDESARRRVEQSVGDWLPEFAGRIETHRAAKPLFEHYGVDAEVERALKPRVSMKCGGYLIIEQTEAMTTIDVNTGSYLGGCSPEETAYRTNLDAARVIPRQLRLRNLAGIIVIDFIDMCDEDHRRDVLRVLEKACEGDSARVCAEGFSSLGLVQISRKRTRASLVQQVCEPCRVCDGTGLIKTAETTCVELFRAIIAAAPQIHETAGECVVRAPQGVVDRLIDEDAEHLARLSRRIGREIRVQLEPSYGPGEFDVVVPGSTG